MPNAAVLMIGDELLSGRTRDINLQSIATFLAPYGVPVVEARVVADDQGAIVAAVNTLRNQYTYVFTTGGIGPTHDDITADAIAAAFGVGIDEHADALEILSAHYARSEVEFTPARRRMARIPDGASLIANPVSAAPGFQTGNVFTLAGVPSIARAMLEDIGHRLETGTVVQRVTVGAAGLREGDIAEGLGELAKAHRDVSLGSYPWYRGAGDHGVRLVASTTDATALSAVKKSLEALVQSKGVSPELES